MATPPTAPADDPRRPVSPDEVARIAAQQLGDPDLEAKLRELTPEQIRTFILALEAANRKRRLLLLGYLSALASIVLGLVVAFIVWARHEPGTFVGWVFFVPLGLAGAALYGFGRLANRIDIRVGDVRIDTRGRPVDRDKADRADGV
ncbi:MAG: hypothetical protein D6689_22245 [Deltaproteobacteria bacterium]|nr:MAG: hypothetical protein D6689_22245 [Deltaproteobacteria bacterium]